MFHLWGRRFSASRKIPSQSHQPIMGLYLVSAKGVPGSLLNKIFYLYNHITEREA
jgi:hypothetical protein